MAVSAMTFTFHKRGGIRKLVVDWTSDDTTGAVTGTTAEEVVGRLIKGVTDPGATAPSANYDIVITDAEGADVLAGCLATLTDRHTSTTEQVYFLVKDTAATPLAQSVHPVVSGLLTIAITNAGNSKVGQLILYYENLGR